MRRFGLLGCLAAVGVVVLIVLMWGVGARNTMVNLEEAVDSQWAQVENVYQRRADLIPNLVRTVQGYARHERETLEAVVQARSRVGQVGAGGGGSFNPDAAAGAGITTDPQRFQQFQQAQDQLTGALSRLLVVVERYPDLKANTNFLSLQDELSGTENRITVERMRYNQTAQSFNAALRRFPNNIVANFSGFKPKQYFRAQAGADRAPEVNFDNLGGSSTAAPVPAPTTTAPVPVPSPAPVTTTR